MTGENHLETSNKARNQYSPHPVPKFNSTVPSESDASACQSDPKGVRAFVTPDRPLKQSNSPVSNLGGSNNSSDNNNNSYNNNSNNGAKTQAFKEEVANEYPSTPGGPGSHAAQHSEHRTTSNSIEDETQRFFPATPQYDQIFRGDPKTPSSQHHLQQAPHTPLTRVRLADDVSTPQLGAYSMNRKADSAYLRPRPGPYPQFGRSVVDQQQPSGESSLPAPMTNGNQPQRQQQQHHQRHTAHVIETDTNEVEMVLKPSTDNGANHISASPERTGRGPYTEMMRGPDVSEQRETPMDGKQPSTHLGGTKVKSPVIVTPDGDAGTKRGGVHHSAGRGEGHSHNRSSSFSNMWEFNGAAAPESPFPSYAAVTPKFNAYNQNQTSPQRPYHNSPNPKQGGNIFKYPPSSPVKSNSPPRTANPSQQNSLSYGYQSTSGNATGVTSSSNSAPPYINSPYNQNYPQPTGASGEWPDEPPYNDGSPSRVSPGKRQRVTESVNKKPTAHPTSVPRFNTYNSAPGTQGHPRYPEYPPANAEAFEPDGGFGQSGPRRPPPRILKAPSYPPPPHHPDNANPGSAPYPGPGGELRPHPPPSQGGDYVYGSVPPPHSSHPPSYRPDYYHPNDPAFPPNSGMTDDYHPSEQTYYPDSHAPPPQHLPRPRSAGNEFYDGDYYYPPPQPPRPHQRQHPHRQGQAPPAQQAEETNEVHPLLLNYDLDRDRRVPAQNDSGGSQSPPTSNPNSPERHTPKTPSKQEKDSVIGGSETNSVSSNSPDRTKPSTAAHAAIAAGMTQPPSAAEVDFDIHNPPLKPITLPSNEPACPVPSNVNSHDVLCGRGGGTNTQIGNRRFRSLVQEFQPIYLLCRRKEKPLIARTIVLIIRHRGGRFLKKDEVSGMLFEVGDEKAEAKTSQALREGLDVRKGSSSDSKRKSRKKKQTSMQHDKCKAEPTHQSYGEDVTMADTTPPREGPPSHNDGHHNYPGYYYGYDEYYHGPGGGAGYETHPQHPPPYTPSRKRQRPPPNPNPPGMYHYHPTQPYKGVIYNPYRPPHAPPPSQECYPGPYRQTGGVRGGGLGAEEEHSGWEMDFSPPRSN